jgi:hypothetical protein
MWANEIVGPLRFQPSILISCYLAVYSISKRNSLECIGQDYPCGEPGHFLDKSSLNQYTGY